MLLALGVVLLAPQTPIVVRRDARDSSLEGERVWRTRSRRTYCVLRRYSVMETSRAILVFKTKRPRGRWVVSEIIGGNEGGPLNPSNLLELSDVRAVAANDGPSKRLVFVRGADLKWRLAPSAPLRSSSRGEE